MFQSVCSLIAMLLIPWNLYASGDDPVVPVLLGLAILLAGAKIGNILAKITKQPAVLGELVMGIILGNLYLSGFHHFEFITHSEIFSIIASIGVVLLLFEVGLESSLNDMLKVGVVATIVAVIGVVLPFVLGYFVSLMLAPDKSIYVHVFVGATLTATSVGITARVLKDMGKVNTKEAKIILGAAVIDDVLGLIILAIVSGIITAADSGANLDLQDLAMITIKAIGFLVLSLVLGSKIAPYFFKLAGSLKIEGGMLGTALIFCFVLSYLASLVNLAPIVGAFAAGLIIDGAGYKKHFSHDHYNLEELIFPISKFFVPLFFVHMGMKVDFRTFLDLNVIFTGLVLSFVAIIGKQVCGLGIFGKEYKDVSKISVGIGMIPRGEVGLIFALMGSTLIFNNQPIIDQALYSAIILMVMITTVITPPALKWSIARAEAKKG